MIRLERVRFGYGAEVLLREVSCRMEDGRITALLGANGCGKTTLLKLCARLLSPAAGTVEVDGAPLASYAPRALARTLSYLPQERPLPAISVRALAEHGRFPHLGFGHRLGARDERIVEEALAATEMAQCADRDVRTLSGGQRQRAYLAMLIAQGARNLLLDEPTTYLDARCQLEVIHLLQRLRAQGYCICAVFHDLDQALRACDRAIVLGEGRVLYEGDAGGVLESGALEQALRVRVFPRMGLGFEAL